MASSIATVTATRAELKVVKLEHSEALTKAKVNRIFNDHLCNLSQAMIITGSKKIIFRGQPDKFALSTLDKICAATLAVAQATTRHTTLKNYVENNGDEFFIAITKENANQAEAELKKAERELAQLEQTTGINVSFDKNPQSN